MLGLKFFLFHLSKRGPMYGYWWGTVSEITNLWKFNVFLSSVIIQKRTLLVPVICTCGRQKSMLQEWTVCFTEARHVIIEQGYLQLYVRRGHTIRCVIWKGLFVAFPVDSILSMATKLISNFNFLRLFLLNLSCQLQPFITKLVKLPRRRLLHMM